MLSAWGLLGCGGEAAKSPREADAAVDPDGAAVADGSVPADASGGGAAAGDAAQPGPGLGRASLALPELWNELEAGEDPFDDRPATVDCALSAVMAETLSAEHVLSVDTGRCAYYTATQPSLRAVAQGEVLTVRLWHFALTAPEPAEAHAAVMIDGLVIMDERIAIPQPGGLIVAEVAAERAIPAGAPVLFHLHNHGENSWSLVELSAGPER